MDYCRKDNEKKTAGSEGFKNKNIKLNKMEKIVKFSKINYLEKILKDGQQIVQHY